MMDYRLRLYCQIDGVDYYDWTVCFQDSSYLNDFIESGKNVAVIGADIVNRFEEENCKYLDDNFVPKHGSSIHLVSGCPVGIADVRKNYTLKRKPDDGECNVFSPFNGSWRIIWNSAYAIIPSKRTIVLSNQNRWDNSGLDIEHMILHFFPEEAKTNELVPVMIYKKDIALFFTVIQEEWLMLLKGELKKPCISYKKLEFKTDNEVNQDILYLVYKTGIQRYNEEAKKAFHIQLCALNEHNWRDYPGTISILLSQLLRPRRGQYCLDDLGSPSRLPKAVKEMMSHCRHTYLPFKSQEDLAMAQKLIKYIVDIPDDMQFSSIDKIIEKFREKCVDIECFYRLFDNIVKFRPKAFKENES